MKGRRKGGSNREYLVEMFFVFLFDKVLPERFCVAKALESSIHEACVP